MLSTIGVHSCEDLFSTIPPKLRESANFELSLPGLGKVESGLSEHELRKYFLGLSKKNAAGQVHFLGGGVYDNVLPSLVNQLALRGEFLTCYTPYQPEISQGTLQSIFEFQTLISRITAMEVANASMYDGATATAEAVLMAQRLVPKAPNVLVASSLHPDYKEVSRTLTSAHSKAPQEISWTPDGTLDLNQLSSLLKTQPVCAVVVGYPNYFGIIEPLDQIREIIPKQCMLIVSVADISALSIFEPPGVLGADIVVGEAHQLGTPMSFGGPQVGFFATRRSYIRQMPGRLVGETVDCRGQRAYTLTLATREQHIRREKATSNICTNQGLIALRTTIYLSFLGKHGFVELGESNYSKLEYLINGLGEQGIPLKFKNALHYREAVFEIPNLLERFEKAIGSDCIPGIRMQKKWGTDFSTDLLICVHPKHSKEDLDRLIEVISNG